MAARDGARSIALGRVVAGVALVAAPSRAGRFWLGPDADVPATRAVTRALGVRDLLIGFLTLHTVDRPQVGARMVAAAALADAVDAVSFAKERHGLAGLGGPVVIGVAASSAVAGFVLSRQMQGPGAADVVNVGPIAPGA